MTINQLLALKPGDKVKVVNFAPKYDGHEVVVQSLYHKPTFNWKTKAMEPEIVTQSLTTQCACCSHSETTRLGLHACEVEKP